MKAGAVLRLAASAFALALSACGGGGGGGDAPATRPALPQLVSDTYPAGERVDLQSRNYFPAAAGDSWIYSISNNGISTGQTATRTVTSAAADTFTITETAPDSAPQTESYRRTSSGILQLDLASDLSSTARALVGEVMMFPEPFYPVGGTRSAVRQGSWGEDEDGDGVVDSFRFELRQQLVGFETVTVPLGPLEAVHFHTTITVTASPSSLQNTPQTITATEESWWAPGIGLVRVDRTLTDENGVTSRQSLTLDSGSVGGAALISTTYDGTVRKIGLTHNALAFDITRNVYYASIPNSVSGTGNRIATIDAATGAVSHSAVVGTGPFALAMAPDGSALYVGLDGSGDIAKLSLPAMAEQYRVRLPVESNLNTQLVAQYIAVSPTEADVLAVSLRNPGASGYYPGVVQIRAASVQPQQFATTPMVGMGPIAYDGNGASVYGYGTNFGTPTLYALSVRGDGLVVSNSGSQTTGHGVRDIDWTPQGIIASRGIYRSSDLAQLAVVAPYACRAHTVANRQLCIGVDSARLSVVDTTTFGILATPAYSTVYTMAPRQLVPGAAGQVALRFGSPDTSQPATDIWLFTSPQLQ